MKWYNDVIAFILDYISGSIKNSEVSGFYRYNIGFKNLLRSIEYGRKASTFGYRYLAQGFLERKYQHDFIRYEWLRKEYRNQTFQFLPEVSVQYTNITRGLYYGTAQQLITYKRQYQRLGLSNANLILFLLLYLFTQLFHFPDRTGEISTEAATVDYFTQGLEHSLLVKEIVDNFAKDIEIFAQNELDRYNKKRIIPLVIVIVVALMVPIIIYVTYLSTTSMFKYN